MEGKGPTRTNESGPHQKAVGNGLISPSYSSKTNLKIGRRDSIKCVYFNARSIVNKLPELELLVKGENIDVLGISETWLFDDVSDGEISFNGYSLFRCDRNDPVKTRGGGVLLYIRNELNPSQVYDLCDSGFQESIWCNVKCMNNSFNIGVVYRATDSSNLNDEAMYKLIDKLYDKKSSCTGRF